MDSNQLPQVLCQFISTSCDLPLFAVRRQKVGQRGRTGGVEPATMTGGLGLCT